MSLEHVSVPGQVDNPLNKKVDRRGFLKIAAGVGAAAGLAAVGGIAIPMISSDGEGANPNPDTQPLSVGNGTPTPDNDPTVTPDTDPTVSPTATPEATKTPETKVYPPDSFRPAADKLGLKVGVLMADNDLIKLNAAGLTEKLVGNKYNRLIIPISPKVIAPTRKADGRVSFNFSSLDKPLKYGIEHQMDILPQHLSWWRSNSVGGWVNDIKDHDDADAVLVDWVTSFMKRFDLDEYTIAEYGPRFQRKDLMYEKWGPRYLFRVAEITKSIKPNAKIFYNDTGNEIINDSSNRDYDLMQEGAVKGLFDGIYFQGHFFGTGNPPKIPTYDQLVTNFERFKKLNNGNFQVGIDEFGVDEASIQGTPEEKAKAIADLAEASLKAILAIGGNSFSVTGAYDVSLALAKPTERVLFDAQGNANPAADKILQVLNNEVAKQGK